MQNANSDRSCRLVFVAPCTPLHLDARLAH